MNNIKLIYVVMFPLSLLGGKFPPYHHPSCEAKQQSTISSQIRLEERTSFVSLV